MDATLDGVQLSIDAVQEDAANPHSERDRLKRTPRPSPLATMLSKLPLPSIVRCEWSRAHQVPWEDPLAALAHHRDSWSPVPVQRLGQRAFQTNVLASSTAPDRQI